MTWTEISYLIVVGLGLGAVCFTEGLIIGYLYKRK